MGTLGRTQARRRVGALAVVAVIAAMLISSPTPAGAGEGQATADYRVERILHPLSGGGCYAVTWLIIDVVDNAVEYLVDGRRVSPNEGPVPSSFSPFTSSNRSTVRGTEWDRADTETEMNVLLDDRSSAQSCATATGWHEFVVDSVEAITFVPDPPTPTTAAFEFQTVESDNGLGSIGCTAYMWISVPEVPGAASYTVSYLASGTPVSVNLEPEDFNQDPPSSSHSTVTAYDTPGRLGHFVGSSGGASGGCDRRMWDMNVNGANFTDPTFTVQLTPCLGQTPTIVAQPGVETVGTAGPDVILGTDGPDVIRGMGGADLICSMGGNDRVHGNGGADRIVLGGGNDRAVGGPGRDTIVGGRGADRINGNGGADTIRGGGGGDTINGGGGRDNLFGNNGRDTLNGGPGADRCSGGRGADTLISC